MSGFTSPYEEDNPFADLPGSGQPTINAPSPDLNAGEPHQSDRASIDADSEFALKARESNVPEFKQSTTPPKTTLQPTARDMKASASVRRSGGARKPIRAAAIASRLETLDLDNDPLGPLGSPDNRDPSPPPPPIKESIVNKNVAAPRFESPGRGISRTPSYRSSDDHHAETHAQSIPLEQAANPNFAISVGDPTKIGDITSAHTVYKVSTKTNSKAYKVPEFSATRRYRDFLWLYDQLNRNCPGVIVPPPPEKQAVGRFSENFIEARRYALERMLEKISKHPVLRGDGDFKLFLESESFSADIKHRPIDQRLAHEGHKGFLGLGSAFSMSGKFVETDEYFDQQKISFDNLDHQLKQLSKAVDIVIRQRKDLAHTTSEFGAALSALSTIELSRSLSDALGSLSDLQDKIKELHERQAQQDILTIGHTVEEYIRLISSVKTAFTARQKAWFAWQQADSDSAKRKSTGDKIRRQARTQTDRLNMVDQEMTDAERRSHAAKLEFDSVSKLLKSEIKKFEADKVEDFKTSVEVFLESAVEAQKELIEHWEFYSDLLAKDLDEDVDEPSPTAAHGVQISDDSSTGHPQEASGGSSAPVEEQETVLEDTTIEPITPTTPKTANSMSSSGLPIPHDEANPFARESL